MRPPDDVESLSRKKNTKSERRKKTRTGKTKKKETRRGEMTDIDSETVLHVADRSSVDGSISLTVRFPPPELVLVYSSYREQEIADRRRPAPPTKQHNRTYR